MNVEPLRKKVINKPLLLLLLLLSASTGLLWSCCGSKVSPSEGLKRRRGARGEKKKEEIQKGKEKWSFFLSPQSPLPFPSSPTPWMPSMQASVFKVKTTDIL